MSSYREAEVRGRGVPRPSQSCCTSPECATASSSCAPSSLVAHYNADASSRIRPPRPTSSSRRPLDRAGSTIIDEAVHRDDDDDENVDICCAPYSPRSRPRRTRRWHWPPSLSIALLAVFLATIIWPVAAHDHDAAAVLLPRGLTPRDLSKRALPGDVNDIRHALARRQQATATSQISEEHRMSLSMSPPKTCAPMNITWDPTKGTPPFTLLVVAELWFQLAVVSIPETYADPTLRQWLYQLDLPCFKDAPEGVTDQPAIVASIIDSTGMMANTSDFMQVDNSDESCDRAQGAPEFESWSEGPPVMCGPWKLGWNVTGTGFVGPMLPFMLPERQPPVLIPSPDEAQLVSAPDGSGGFNWNVTVPYGTLLLFHFIDQGNGKTGGVGGRNQVALDQYVGTNCAFADKIALPTPITTAKTMTVTPDYTTSITTTSDGNVLTVPTVVRGSGPEGNNLSTGGIAGIALGVAAAAALVLLVIFIVFYRRSKKRQETLWEIPGGGSNYPSGMPVDKRLAASRNMAAAGAAGAAAGGRGQSLHGSFRSLGSSGYDGTSSSSGGALRHGSGDAGASGFSPIDSPPTPSAFGVRGGRYVPYSDNSPQSRSGSPFEAGRGEAAAVGGIPTSATTSSNGSSSNYPHAHHQLANAYRSALGTTNPSEGDEDGSLEEVPLAERVYSSGAGEDKLAAERSRPAVSTRGSHTESTSTAPRRRDGASGGSRRQQHVVVHSDAGLLLDDSLSDDEDNAGDGGGAPDMVELPPEYNSIPARQRRTHGGTSSTRSREQQSQQASQRQQSSLVEEEDISSRDALLRQQQSQPERTRLDELAGGDEDDEAFWRR